MSTEQTTIPFDLDVEREVLSAGASYETARAWLLDERAVKPTDFHVPAHQVMWSCVTSLHAAGHPVSEGSVIDAARRNPDWLTEAGIQTEQLRETFWSVVANGTITDPAHHAEILLDLSERRRLLAACWATITELQRGDRPAHETRSAAEQRLQESGIDERATDVITAAEAITSAMVEWEKPAQMRGLSTGFQALDGLLKGMRPGQLIVLGARPSMGKSALALDLCRDVAFRQSRRVLLISMEMVGDEVAGRTAAAETSIPHDRLTLGGATDTDWRRVLALADLPQASNLMLTERADLSVSDIASIARTVARQHPDGLDLLVVDYLQLLRASNPRDTNRNNQVSLMSRGLKVLAQQLKCPVIAISQLSRANESRLNKRPMLSDLRDSGSIEQDANVVLLLHREDYYNRDAPPGMADLIVAKNRGGRIGELRLLLEGSYPRFASAPPTGSTAPSSPTVPYPDVPLPAV